jgi:hypothetical protein
MAPYIMLFNSDTLTGQTLTDNVVFDPTYAELTAKRVMTIEPTFTAIDTGSNSYTLVSSEKQRICKLDATCKVYLALIHSTNNYATVASEKFYITLKGNL